ncbi:MAG: hypothetical protein WDA00_00645 [Eubacteriales bacterium]
MSTIPASILPVKDGAVGIVSFVYDDGFMDTCLHLGQLFERYGLLGNIAMIGKHFADVAAVDDAGQYTFTHTPEQRQKIEDFRRFFEDYPRFQIISHSMTHRAFGFDEENLRRETVAPQQLFRQIFPGQDVLSYAYPGFADDGTREAQFRAAVPFLAQAYIAVRGVTTGLPQPLAQLDPAYPINTCSTRQVTELYTSADKRTKDAIMASASVGGWTVITSHNITDELSEIPFYVTKAYYQTLIDFVYPFIASGRLWCAYFTDAVQYLTERDNASLTAVYDEASQRISLTLTHTLDREKFFYPLTVRVTLPPEWHADSVRLQAADRRGQRMDREVTVESGEGGRSVTVNLTPNQGAATLTPIGA